MVGAYVDGRTVRADRACCGCMGVMGMGRQAWTVAELWRGELIETMPGGHIVCMAGLNGRCGKQPMDVAFR